MNDHTSVTINNDLFHICFFFHLPDTNLPNHKMLYTTYVTKFKCNESLKNNNKEDTKICLPETMSMGYFHFS